MSHIPTDASAWMDVRADAPAAAPADALVPIAAHERIGSLDLLRGFALLGILLANMPLFGMPVMVSFGTPALVDGPSSERVAWWIVAVGVQWSFISLFSLLFGAGFAVMNARATALGQSVAPLHLRRAALLLLFGLLHVALLWMGDILFLYGLLAVPLLALGLLRPRSLAIIGTLMLLFAALATSGAAVISYFAGEVAVAVEPEAATTGEALRGFAALKASQFNPADPRWLAAEAAAHVEGPYLTAMMFRLMFWAFVLLSGAFTFAWQVLGLFCLGTALMRSGFFDAVPSEATARLRRLLLIGIPAGLALKAVHAWVTSSHGWELSVSSSATSGVQMLGGAMMALGFAALGTIIVRDNIASAPVRWIGRAGRMPLTLYLMQSLVAVAIMDHWGLARFGTVDRMSMIGLTLVIWVAQVLLANIWLSTFRMGPLEWLWRLGTYLRPARMR